LQKKTININKAFSAFINESYGTLMCRMHDRETLDSQELEYKKFVIEYRKLNKIKDQRDAAKLWKLEHEKIPEDKEKDEYAHHQNKDNKKKMQDDIKATLIDSIISKRKLKKQLKSLKDKKIKDEKLINDNLKLTNLDDSY